MANDESQGDQPEWKNVLEDIMKLQRVIFPLYIDRNVLLFFLHGPLVHCWKQNEFFFDVYVLLNSNERNIFMVYLKYIIIKHYNFEPIICNTIYGTFHSGKAT
jgi:hypothetical protein